MIKTSPFAMGDMPNNNPIANTRINCSCHSLISRVVKKSFLFSVPPKVVPVPPDGQFVVRKGSTITLTCQVSGNPRPKITWQRSVRLFKKIWWRSAKCLNPSGKNSQVLSGWALCIATKTNLISISCVLRLKLGCGILSYDIVRHPAPL